MDHSNLPVVCTVKVVYAYLAKEEGDLTLQKGDIIKVYDNEGGWWKGSLLPDNIFGIFPSNFVQILSVGEDSLESPLSPTCPQGFQRAHSRQNSVDSSKFTRRKPVNNTLSATAVTSSSTTSLPYPDTSNASNVSLSIAASRKNPQAIIGDMNQFEEPVHSSPRSEPQQPHQQQQQNMSRRQSQSSQKSTQSRFGHTASHITGILSPVSPTSTSAAGETQGSRVTPKQISTFPGVFPTPARDSPTKDKPVHDADRRYSQALLSPTSPTTMITSPVVGGRYLTNRISMPNLAGDAAHPHRPFQDSYHSSNSRPTRANSANGPPPGKMYLQDTNNVMRSSSSGTRSAYHLPRRNASEISVGRFGDENASFKQELHNTQDPRQSQSGMMPRSTTEYYNQQMLAAGLYHPFAGVPPAQQPYGYNSTGATPYQQPRSYQQRITICGADQPQYSRGHHLGLYSDLSLEALAMHDRSQSALDPPRPHASHGSVHGRSHSQVNLRREGSVAFNPYDHQHQQQPSYYPLPMPPQAQSAPMNRLSFGHGVAGPSITIPPVRGARPQSALASYGALTASPTESSPSTSATSVTYPYRFPNSPPTPGTGRTGTPTSAGTSMSAVSVMGSTFGPREQRRKSETARMAPSASMTASTFTARKFSVDAGTTLASSTTSASFLAHIALPPAPPNMSGRETATGSYNNPSVEDTSDPQEGLGTYTAKKPKATLFRTIKQIINPRKVAEKDAVKHNREHFAWVKMQKSLRRVPSPDIGKERPFFAPEDGLDEPQDQDPFEVLKRCHVMRDTSLGPGATTVNSLLDVGPAAFTQVDKVARNVNQRGPHMTPQLLSQKYLTRPYAKAPLSKLRVLFVWVSENIRLEGGPTRDVSGGRYKLGPGGDPMSTAQSNVNAAGESPNLRTGSNGGVGSPSPSATAAARMAGPDDHSRGLLQEDSPELAQEVLASRTSKTGEGFANLFAEMALAAGIEDVGVVKGYIKGPMDVFSKEVPPANHAWNVVRINGTYRFIDCCLASPFHPAHYPNRPQTASSFYFLTSPMDLVLSHFPVSLMYQYITPSIPPQIFLRLPFVRPAFFDFGLSLPEFKRRTRLDIKGDESIEVVIRIDGGGSSPGSVGAGASTIGGGHNPVGGHKGAFAESVSGLFGGECLGRGCGEGIELRAEVEAMTAEGRVIKQRALAQIMIWNPYQTQVAAMTAQAQPQQQQVQCDCASSSVNVNGSTGVAAMAAGQHYHPHQRLFLPHHCSGIRIAKIKAVFPSETVVGAGGIRKGVVHIYAGRKVEMAPADATPYSLALSLPIRHTGTMPTTPFNFVLPHFSPYEFYVKSPQSEMLYYPHTYKFCVLSLAAQGQASAVSANAVAIVENDAVMAMAVIAGTSSSNMGATVGGSTSGTSSPRHKKANNSNGTAGSTGSASMAPMYRPQPNAQQSLRSGFNPPAGAGGPLTATSTSSSIPFMSNPPSMHPSATTASMGMFRLTGGQHYPRLHQHQQYHSQYQMSSSISMASTSSMSVNGVPSTSSNTGGGVAIPRPERLVLRTQMNRIYKLAYDPVRQCHEAEVEVKERGIWECVRMDDGGKSRVGREGAGGVVIATWRCV